MLGVDQGAHALCVVLGNQPEPKEVSLFFLGLIPGTKQACVCILQE